MITLTEPLLSTCFNPMTNKRRFRLALLFLTLIAFVLRFYQAASMPPSLNWDEASHGYNAFSILQTSSDEWGFRFPLLFRAFGDFKLPLYIYLTTIPVSVLGLTPLAVRLVSIISGTLAIPLIYFLTLEFFPRKRILIFKKRLPLCLIAAALLTFLPWHFFLSRPALEANLALTLIMAAILFLHRGLTKPNNYFLASLFFGLSLHAYNSARVFVPLFLIAFFLIYRRRLRFDWSHLLPLALLSLLATPVVYQIINGTGMARYQKLAILSDNNVFQIGQDRANSRLPDFLARLIHNRPVFFVTTILGNYLSYFSLGFFTQVSGSQSQFAIPGQHLLTISGYVMAAVGLYYLLGSLRRRRYQLLFAWLLLAPLPAALTADPPQALRPLIVIPVLVLLMVFALKKLLSSVLNSRQQTISLFIIFFVYLTCSFLYIKDYFTDYRSQYSQSWQYGYQQLYQYLDEVDHQVDHVFVTKRYGEPHIFYSFYHQTDPHLLWPNSESSIRFYQDGWYWTDQIDNYYFVNDWQIPDDYVSSLPLESGGDIDTSNSLLVTTPEHFPDNGQLLKTINFLDGQTAFAIIYLP